MNRSPKFKTARIRRDGRTDEPAGREPGNGSDSGSNLPFLLGTMFTPDRARARLVGFGVHSWKRMASSAIYRGDVSFRAAPGGPRGGRGAAIGLAQPPFVLLAAMPASPFASPEDGGAKSRKGPTPTRQLQPPGFMAVNYGRRTPITVILAHLVYGAILGAFYRLK